MSSSFVVILNMSVIWLDFFMGAAAHKWPVKIVLKISQGSQENTSVEVSTKKLTQAQVFFLTFSEIFHISLLGEHLWETGFYVT